MIITLDLKLIAAWLGLVALGAFSGWLITHFHYQQTDVLAAKRKQMLKEFEVCARTTTATGQLSDRVKPP